MQILVAIILGFVIGFISTNKVANNTSKAFSKYITEAVNILKGIILVLFLKFIFNFEFELILIALIFGLIVNSFFNGFKFEIKPGHFFAFGGLLFLIPAVDLIWLFIWVIAFIYKNSLDFSFISSTFLIGLLSVTSSEMLNNEYWYTSPLASTNLNFQILLGVLFTITFISQLDLIRTYFGKTKT